MSMLTRHGWRSAILAIALAGALTTTASAAVTDLAIDDEAQLSPGMLHATLTGSMRCDPGDFFPYFNSLTGQISQLKGGAGFGSMARALVSTSTCDPFTFLCTSQYVDAVIRLKK